MSKFHLWPEETVVADGLTTASITIESPNGHRQHIWYRFPEQYRGLLTTSCDPFVIGVLMRTMHHNYVSQELADLEVHGQVSPSLLRNLVEFQAVWGCWRPTRYKPIEIYAELEQELPRSQATDLAISTFSGGLDSCFTALRHSKGLCDKRSRQNLKAGVFINGFDIRKPIPKEQFERTIQHCRKMLASLGMDLIPVETNVRLPAKGWSSYRWDCQSTVTASSLMLFQGAYGTGLIPSGEPYNALADIWGSHPLIDPLLSSQSFPIIHDGAAFNRIEKIEQLAQWPEALEGILVCWNHFEQGGNCCRCEKCIRTILNFRAAGLGLPGAFKKDVNNLQILGLATEPLNTTQPINLMLIIKAAKTNNIQDSWVTILKTALLLNFFIAYLRLFKNKLRDRIKAKAKPA